MPENRKHEDFLHYHKDMDEIDLSEILGTIWTHKVFILLVTFFAVFCAWVYTVIIPQEYEASSLIQIDSKSNAASGIKSFDIPGEMGGSLSSASSSQIESALIKSRFVIQPAIEFLGLDIQVKPNSFPLLSKFFIHYHKNSKLAKPFWGMNKYVWGGESISVKQFKVPNNFLDQVFTIVAGANDTYQLYFDHKLVLNGKVGENAESEITSKIPEVKILITDLRANGGAEFKIYQQPLGKVLKEISKNLAITDIGGAGSPETGILNVVFRGTNQWLLPKVLNTILAYDIQNNVDKKNLEIQKTLGFLEQQVPILKDSLEQAETALNDFRATTGLSNEAAGGKNILLDKLVTLDQTLEAIKLKKEDLLQTFTEKHPLIISLNAQQKRLEKELAVLEGEIKNLPKDQQKALSLERDIKVKDQLYSLLLGKIQELQIVQAGIVSDVRVLNAAVAANPLPSKQLVILGIGALIGLILAIIIIFIRKLLTKMIDNPDEVESRLGIPAYAFVPYSKEQKRLTQLTKQHVVSGEHLVLAKMKPRDLAVESLRSLRTMLQFALQDTKTNIVTILGTSPAVGKSFVALNLAQLLVDSGKKVLLIDADLRKGKLHSYFGMPSKLGFAEVLAGEISFEQAKRTLNEKMDLLTCGKAIISPADLFIREQFKQTVALVSSLYDLVIIDTPPVLAVTDSMIMLQKITSVNVLLVAIGADTLPGVEHVIKRFSNNGAKISGLVFNNLTRVQYGYGNYGYYHNYYYYYDNKKKDKD